MKYIKTFENYKIKGEDNFSNYVYGLFFGVDEIKQALKYLDDKNVKYDLLHVYDDPGIDTNKELMFLILVDKENIEKVDVDVTQKLSGVSKHRYILIDDTEIYFNFFRQEDLDEYGLKQISKEELNLLIAQNKYNL